MSTDNTYWIPSNRPRPTAAISEDETPLSFLLRLFREGKLEYRDGELYSLYDFRGKGRRRGKPKRLGNVSSNGYIRVSFRFNGRLYAESAHRIVYAYFHNITEFPDGMVINHKDGNRQNNRIENLELVTPKENVNHAINTGLRDVGNTNTAKLNWGLVDEIRCKYSTGKYTYAELAEFYGVHKSTIARICQNRAWIRGGKIETKNHDQRLA